MRTDDLIVSLTAGLQPAPRRMVPRLICYAGCIGLGASLLILLSAYGPRNQLPASYLSGSFWLKSAYAASLGLASYILCERLARPGARLGALVLLPALPVALLVGTSIPVQWQLPQSLRMAAWLGHSSWVCSLKIGLVSLPVFAALCRALRLAAPTQLRAAAACAGLLSGAIAALAYALFCSETGVSFVATWYTLGMLLPALAGAIFGNTLLRWA